MKVAVAVVSYNTRDLLAECLESLSGDDRLEVWVVDNASSDGSAEMVRAGHPWARLIESSRSSPTSASSASTTSRQLTRRARS